MEVEEDAWEEDVSLAMEGDFAEVVEVVHDVVWEEDVLVDQ